MLDYGIVGNGVTCALVKKNASVDWMCYPTFSSPTVLARLLDSDGGGSIEIHPEGEYQTVQRYVENTGILETRFESKSASFSVYDFFPRYRSANRNKKIISENRLVRLFVCNQGEPAFTVRIDVRPDYARKKAEWVADENGFYCRQISELRLASDLTKDQLMSGARIALSGSAFLAFGHIPENRKMTAIQCKKLLHATQRNWEKWVQKLQLPEQNRTAIIRSAITLKLLTYRKTGAMLAAATTSVPEEMGTTRTFDYRFCWVRDATMAADALKKIGCEEEPKALLEFLMSLGLQNDFVQIMYGIEGETQLTEKELPHLSGYHGSKPVRVGNAAYIQTQHDIYGELIDTMFLYFVYYGFEPRLKEKHWRFLRYLVNQIKFNYERPDNGIWEFRGKPLHFTYSKFMCLVGVNRAIQIAIHFKRFECAQEWMDLNNALLQNVLDNGYNPNVGAFTMHYGGTALDASLLLMAYYDFLPPNDPRLVNTIKKIYNELGRGGLLQRYSIEDDFGQSKSAFLACSFWLVDALYYIGEETAARELFGRLSQYANHLGLFSEDIDFSTGEQTGNFPQAYCHIAHINTAILLSEWSKRRKKFSLVPKPVRKAAPHLYIPLIHTLWREFKPNRKKYKIFFKRQRENLLYLQKYLDPRQVLKTGGRLLGFKRLFPRSRKRPK